MGDEKEGNDKKCAEYFHGVQRRNRVAAFCATANQVVPFQWRGYGGDDEIHPGSFVGFVIAGRLGIGSRAASCPNARVE
jgi:hypothetical protein